MITEKMVGGKLIIIEIKPKMDGFKVWFNGRESLRPIKQTIEKAYFDWCRACWSEGVCWDSTLMDRIKYGF